MKANRKFIEGQEEAVSAVIGVILMVAITVAIAATVYVYVSGMVGGNTKSTPTISLTSDTSDTNCTLMVASVSTQGCAWNDITYTLIDKTNTTQFPGTTWGGSAVAWGGASVILTNPSTGNVLGGQIITIKAAAGATCLTKGHQYTLTLQYRPTGGTLSTSTWTQ